MGFSDSWRVGYETGATSRANNRQEKQDQLTALQQGYELNNAGSYEPTENKAQQESLKAKQMEAQLLAVQASNKSLQSQLSVDGITNTIDSVIDGNWKDAKLSYSRIKDIMAASPGLDVADIGPINFSDFTDMNQLEDMGIDTEKINTPEIQDSFNRSMMKITGLDGTTRIRPVDSIMKATNTWNMMNTKQQDKYTKNTRNINSILTGAGLLPGEAELQESKIALAQTTTDVGQEVATNTLNILQEAIKNGATIGEIDSILNPPKELTLAEQTAKFKLGQDMNTAQIKESSKAIVEDIVATDKDWSQQQITMADKLQGPNKLTTKDADLFQANFNTIEGLSPLYTAINNISDKDWNALSRLNTEMAKLGGDAWTDLQNMSPEDKKTLYLKMGINSQLQVVAAGYIKAMSGAAVTESERTFYIDAIQGGNWGTRQAAMAKMKGFMSQQVKDFNSNSKRIAYSHPRSYIIQRRLFNEAASGFEKAISFIPQEPTNQTVTAPVATEEKSMFSRGVDAVGNFFKNKIERPAGITEEDIQAELERRKGN